VRATGGFSPAEHDRLARDLAEQQQRQRDAFDKRCDSLVADLRAAEQKFDSRMHDLVQSVDAQFVAERQERTRGLAEERARVDRVLAEQARDLQGQIAALERRVENEAAAAEQWLRSAAAEIDAIRTDYRHHMFCPGELAPLENRLAMARENDASGIHQAALGLAQETSLQATFLREKLELLTMRWEAAKALAIQSLESGLGALEEGRTFQLSDVEIADGEGERIEAARDVDTDHWTAGAWASRHDALRVGLQRVRAADCTAGFDELESLRKLGEATPSESVALQATAKYALMASLLRSDLQARFAERLAGAGYEVIDNAWAGNDERGENHLVLRGVNGDEISIVLAPKPGESSFSNRIKVLFRTPDGEPNEQERAERLASITQILREAYDLPADAGFLDCAPGTETLPNAPADAFDLDRIRASSPAVAPQARKEG
jgi:outer membrane murein-binding lipoprotein Lpp